MVAFGWHYHKLATTRSDLTDSIQLYTDLTDSIQLHTDLQQLAHDMEHLTITQPLRFLGVGEGPGALEAEFEKRGDVVIPTMQIIHSSEFGYHRVLRNLIYR
jgi:hypothetical protein